MTSLFIEQPAFTTHPKSHQTSREGVSITFSSDADGIPEPTFSWAKDGSAVTANCDRISLSPDNKELSLTNVSRRDSGEYRCVATNSVGKVNSNAASLTVHCKKAFTRFLFLKTQLKNHFHCSYPGLSWINKGGKDVLTQT